ncbi:MAG: TolC family protein [Vicinamibacteria bacterium]|nr:TolC family protein [Vicinamibacteria bacterium]
MSTRLLKLVIAGAFGAGLVSSPHPAGAQTVETFQEATASGRVLGGISDPRLAEIVSGVLARNPRIAQARARARAARLQAPQMKALPDPMLGATAFGSMPETRVGPQTIMGTVSQRFPWFGKLSLREKAALQRADALDADVEALRLNLVTETRRLYYETAFLDAWRDVVDADRETLIQFEELARSRYSSGVGIEQAVVKVQAEITRDEMRLLDIETRRATTISALNSLRDLPQNTAVPKLSLPSYSEIPLDRDTLRARAMALRPEMSQADSEIARAETLVDLARKEYKPDITVAATYTRVGLRSDPAGIASPPPDNGKDVFAISASINLPIKRGKLRAGVDEAAEVRTTAAEGKRSVVTDIDRSLGELSDRIALTFQQLRLFDRVLGLQADQSLRSAQAAYASGSLSSLDLLDAERVLLEVRTATERARADYAIAIARLEGAVGEPLTASGGLQP